MTASPKKQWDQFLQLISENVSDQVFATWFKPIVFKSYNPSNLTLLVGVPSPYIYEYLEAHFVELMGRCLHQSFGANTRLNYYILTDKEHGLTQKVASDPTGALMPRPEAEGFDSQLRSNLTFDNYIEGKSNKVARSIGLSIAEHPNTHQFNPMFIYGPSGCGKTHLINAIGLRCKKLFPEKRVLYISARLFQVQYVTAYLQKHLNDFIMFYQTIDVLIVDDIQEWMGKKPGTLDTFFHIFNHLFRNGKRIILASDRPPVDLKDIPERLLTRFCCGLITELEKPDHKLCEAILRDLVQRNGIKISEDVIDYVARNADCSIRDLQGVINGLLAYSITYGGGITMRLAERCIKRAVKVDDKPLTVDEILDIVCDHYHVTASSVNSKSRKHDYVQARQVSMYFAQKYTRMPASRIGKLIGGRDHSTVIHSCTTVEKRLKTDQAFQEEMSRIERAFKLKQS